MEYGKSCKCGVLIFTPYSCKYCEEVMCFGCIKEHPCFEGAFKDFSDEKFKEYLRSLP